MNTVNRLVATATAWLTPGRRRALYAATAALGALLVALGVVDAESSTTYVAAAVGVLEAVTLLLASYKARSGLRTAVYAVAASLLVALKLAGVITDGQESHLLELFGHGLALAGLVLAVLRTSPDTPTGEPLNEYAARGYGSGV